ncbi:MAG: hypothetical protein V4537_18145 [Pseudomonadota bacterium]
MSLAAGLIFDPRDTCENDHPGCSPEVGASTCLCGWVLLPIGTTVQWRGGEIGKVASWHRQDHWKVPVTFPGSEYAIVRRDDLTVVEGA